MIKHIRKNLFSYILVLGGFGLMIYSNWQFCAGIFLMLCGGYMWQLINAPKPKIGEPGHYATMRNPPPPPTSKKEVERKEANASNLKVE